jgi:hypothetical protein
MQALLLRFSLIDFWTGESLTCGPPTETSWKLAVTSQ